MLSLFNIPKPGDESQVEVEHILEPLYGSGRLIGKHLDEIRPRLVARRLESVIVELLHAIGNLVVDLRPCEGAVDSRGGLGGVASHEVWRMSDKGQFETHITDSGLTVFVEQHYIATGKINGVGRAQAGHWRSLSVARIVHHPRNGSTYSRRPQR